jgi:hypothetical protein
MHAARRRPSDPSPPHAKRSRAVLNFQRKRLCRFVFLGRKSNERKDWTVCGAAGAGRVCGERKPVVRWLSSTRALRRLPDGLRAGKLLRCVDAQGARGRQSVGRSAGSGGRRGKDPRASIAASCAERDVAARERHVLHRESPRAARMAPLVEATQRRKNSSKTRAGVRGRKAASRLVLFSRHKPAADPPRQRGRDKPRADL